MLAGVETLLYQELRPGVMFKGLIDLVFYNKYLDEWTIIDIKTSTSGWRDQQKKNPNLTAQVILYKEFFSKQFGIPKDKINVEYFIVKRRVPVELLCREGFKSLDLMMDLVKLNKYWIRCIR
jgi:hypothetical protein